MFVVLLIDISEYFTIIVFSKNLKIFYLTIQKKIKIQFFISFKKSYFVFRRKNKYFCVTFLI